MTKNRLKILSVFWLSGLLLLASPAAPQERPWLQYEGYDVPFVPTPYEVVDEMLKLAGPKPGDVLYDLGCGDGRIVIRAAKAFGIRAVGIDIDPLRISESNLNASKEGVTGKVRFIEQNLFDADFREATIVTMYLLNSVNLRLRPKLLAELKPGTRLVSHRFDMDNWSPDKTSVVTCLDGEERQIYFWVVPANVSGRWEWDLPEGGPGDDGAEPVMRHHVLTANQSFQAVSASGRAGDWPVDILDVKLTGDRIRFKLRDESDGRMTEFLYEGRVDGHGMTGTVRPAANPKAKPLAWTAVRDPKTMVPLDQAGN